MEAAIAPPLANAYWVYPGLLLAGEHPLAQGAQAARERLARLRDAGIRTIVDLTAPEEIDGYDDALPLAVEYHRKPIPDHGVPARREHMDEILECLHESLEAGRPCYVHCRAGIGRSATVIGCLLIERGLTGEQALAELQRLWEQSARSADWPRIPETPAQREYVRTWQARPMPRRETAAQEEDPLFDAAALAAARALRERFLGALLGLAIGDAVGAATQFRRPGTFSPVADMLGGGPFALPRGAWSDDTAMALCLAQSLLECEGFDPADQVERYRRWQRDGHLSATGQCLGITASTAHALAVAGWRHQPFSGSHDPTQLDPEPLSRVVAPVLFAFAVPAEAERLARESARTTCQANTVLNACADLARALLAALHGETKARILAEQRPAPAGSAGKGVTRALAGAFEAFAATGNFRAAVLHAANLGGDSDVTAAVCGQLAGAFYGASAIPAPWREALLRPSLIEAFADRCLAHALVHMG